MNTILNKAGLYQFNENGRRFLIRVTGIYPLLDITHVISMDDFMESGKLLNNKEMLAIFRANPMEFLCQPFVTESGKLSKKPAIHSVEYSQEDYERWSMIIRHWDYGKAISQILIETVAKGWSVPEVELVYKTIKKKLDSEQL